MFTFLINKVNQFVCIELYQGVMRFLLCFRTDIGSNKRPKGVLVKGDSFNF
jgi:hypothetical protein